MSLSPSDSTTQNKKVRSSGGGESSFTLNRILLKAKYSLYSALIFFVFANPETTLILQRFFGRFVEFVTPCGAPNVTGIFICTGLFFFTMLGLMLLPAE